MQSRRKLRFRLVVSFALFGFGLSALFAFAALNIRTRVEDQLVTTALQQDVDQAVEHVHQDPSKPAGSELVEAWMRSERTLYNMPLAWQSLDSGVHDIDETGANGDKRHYKLAMAGLDAEANFKAALEALVRLRREGRLPGANATWIAMVEGGMKQAGIK